MTNCQPKNRLSLQLANNMVLFVVLERIKTDYAD